jgi:hypothetical protein
MHMRNPVDSRDRRAFNRAWKDIGGVIEVKNGTGELLYTHASMVRAVRINGRRKDTPAVLLSRINQILKASACNDASW